jgi:hypothetical protein
MPLPYAHLVPLRGTSLEWGGASSHRDELAERFPTTRFAVTKHFDVLEKARLVRVRHSGRERRNHLNAVPLQRVYQCW